jgi:amidophosphoribosyltransferase
VNSRAVRAELEGRGAIFSTTSDSEVMVHLLARSRESSLEERLIDALSRVKGAFSVVMLTHDTLVAGRDPNGFRPLVLGRLDRSWVAASETCALDLIGARTERYLDPGEVVVIRRGRLRSLRPFPKAERESFCIFEYIYFARPDSNLRGGTPGSIPSTPTWWCRCSTPEARRRWASQRNRGFPTRRPSFATISSGVPSSSRLSRFATSV